MFWFWPLPAPAGLLESPTKNVTILVVTPNWRWATPKCNGHIKPPSPFKVWMLPR